MRGYVVDGDDGRPLACTIGPVTIEQLVALNGGVYDEAISVQVVQHTPIEHIVAPGEVLVPCDWMYHVCFRKLEEGHHFTWVLPIVRE